MVVETSALVAVLFAEPERDRFIALLAGAEDALISAATLVEAAIVMEARTGDEELATWTSCWRLRRCAAWRSTMCRRTWRGMRSRGSGSDARRQG